MAHVTLRTIRYYDKQGILKPSFVNESGARFYTDEDFARLQQILLLKYLGFSLDDIREMIVDTKDLHYMQNSLNIQLNLVRDRIEQMQLVEKAILETSDAINKQHSIDWSRMLNLIHLTGMEESFKKAVSKCLEYLCPHQSSPPLFPKTNRVGFLGFWKTAIWRQE